MLTNLKTLKLDSLSEPLTALAKLDLSDLDDGKLERLLSALPPTLSDQLALNLKTLNLLLTKA